ncbi:fumarate/nitrate reduction transcriptional regulator Fnr [Zoogloea sp.]|jgi:CRP/FNR family transcriptional regulator|uniref:fumarate/nitrate reduction transcriptional regulator Fnr n=1 Tax=Zoogloea sp. TaxID=49181 RepID=UPI001AC0CCB8|nr:fumarate/nitrate reduction transcriptional regulator Fnr [Zoogloea sp.]MBK6652764.1 fumarate/nitrate reduction transcriptional regulator Fnr [Zoogloea sp.]MBN8284170.1 fumarate/nitrate reduction transcriptional regulator Fnr [Zoogloea sp.]HPI58890.1 fumarate/nitrate reduction transcriptional regulator Fnr [Zoogloea sp.]HRH73338.1 fumarate/nitrate reduction transcriptional regulator Fnr [Zoogloea sp.]
MKSVVPITAVEIKTACSQCNLRELCLPFGLDPREVNQLDELVGSRRKIKRQQHLYRSGDPFEAIYAIRAGSFKTDVILEDGRDQVTGFQMTGEVLGLDGISGEQHSCNAIALEDSEVCVIPFSRLEELSRQVESLQHQFHKIMSREIVRDHGVMMLLGSMRAEERLAAFLLNMSQRFTARGFSPSEFHLRMTRDEIGSYLGLKLETVSRAFSRFQDEGLVAVQQKHIRILDTPGLKRILSHHAA